MDRQKCRHRVCSESGRRYIRQSPEADRCSRAVWTRFVHGILFWKGTSEKNGGMGGTKVEYMRLLSAERARRRIRARSKRSQLHCPQYREVCFHEKN